MGISHTSPVIEFAKDKYKNLDCLGEIYTARILWVSKNLSDSTGYTEEELFNLSPRKLLDTSPLDFMKYIISNFSNTPVKQALIKKDGTKAIGLAKMYSFMFDNEPYVAITNVVIKK